MSKGINDMQKIVIKKPWGVEIKDYKAGDPIPAGAKFKIFDAKDTAKIDAYADSLDESADYQKKRFKEPYYMYNESKKVVENKMVGIISLPVGAKFIDDSFGGKRTLEVVKHGNDDVIHVKEVGTGRKFAYDASTPGGNKKVEKIEEGRIAKGYENLDADEKARHLLSHPSSKYMNDLKSENITERAIRKAVKEMLGKPDKRDPQFIIDVNEDCIKESAFYVKFSHDGKSSKYYMYNNGKHGFTDDKSKATKFSTKEEAEKAFKKNPYYDAFNMKYFDIVNEEGESPAATTTTANVANPELPLKLKEGYLLRANSGWGYQYYDSTDGGDVTTNKSKATVYPTEQAAEKHMSYFKAILDNIKHDKPEVVKEDLKSVTESAKYNLIVHHGKVDDILEFFKQNNEWLSAKKSDFFKQYLGKDPEFVKKEILRHLTTVKPDEILIEKL